MTGFSKFSILFNIVCTELAYLSASMGSIFATYLISAPAQNDLSPLPVITTTFTLSSAETISIADNSAITSTLMAFNTLGLWRCHPFVVQFVYNSSLTHEK